MADSDSTVVREESRSDSDYISYDHCYQDVWDTSNWEYRLAHSVGGDHDSTPIPLGDNVARDFHMHSYFSDLPEDMLYGCDFGDYPYEQPLPKSVQYNLYTRDQGKLNLINPKPDAEDDDSGGTTDEILSYAISILGTLAGGPWTGLAATGFGLALDASGFGDDNDPVKVDHKTYSGSDDEEYVWRFAIDHSDGLDNFPDSAEEDHNMGIKAGVWNKGIGDGNTFSPYILSEFEFTIPTLNGYCPCENYSIIDYTVGQDYNPAFEGA